MGSPHSLEKAFRSGSDARIALALFLLAIAVRAYMIVTADVITPDGLMYIRIARLIGGGNWKAVYEDGFYSTYPFIILLFQTVFTNWETAGRVASAVLGSLAVLPFYFLLRRIFDARVAIVASVFFVLSPRLVQYSSDVLREPLFWCCSLTSLWAAWKSMEEKKWFYIVLASLFAGLAAFTRTEGVALLVIITLWMGWVLLYRERNFKWCFSLFLIFLISFPVIFIGPLYLLKTKTGIWELGHVKTKIPSLLKTEDSALSPDVEKGPPGAGEGGSPIARLLNNRYVASLWETSYKYFRSFHPVLILFLFFGVVRRKVIPYSDKEVPFLMWSCVFLLLSLFYAFKVSYVSTRHGLLMGIPSFLWVSFGFWELSFRLERFAMKKRWNPMLSRHMVIWLLVLACLSILPKTLQSSDRGKMELKTGGIYLKNMGYSNETFAVEPRINRLTFYKGGEFINIPTGIDHSVLRPFLEAADARYLVVDERSIDESVRGFSSHTEALGLERIDLPVFRDYKEYSFTLYRIRK